MLLKRLKANLQPNQPILPDGVGPHEGRELALMLSGQKPCALFYDAIPADGKIPEEIIPEIAFASHVARKTLYRFCREFVEAKYTVRYVCFTLPNEAWRADAIFWQMQYKDRTTDVMVGRLLGYTEDQIRSFLDHVETRKRSA